MTRALQAHLKTGLTDMKIRAVLVDVLNEIDADSGVTSDWSTGRAL